MRLPDAWTVAACAACLGLAAGGGVSVLEAASRPWRAGDVAVGRVSPTGRTPIAETPETRFEFGTVGVGGTGSHEFVIRNAGTAALELTKGTTSCTCTLSDFEESEGGSAGTKLVTPGATASLKVQWRGKGEGGPFRQQASVLTNDPRRPQIEFVIEGTVVPTFRAVPTSIALPKLTSSSSERVTVKLFTYGTKPPEVESLSVADDKTAGFFSLASAPLEADEIAAETGATGGFAVHVDVRPGLPIGAVRQTIRASFRMPETVLAEIPLEGSVTGELMLAGADWDSAHNAVMLGSVSSRAGAQTSLFLTVKGPHRESVKPVVRQVVPESLQVTVGEAKPIGGGNVLRIPLTVTVPPGSPAVNHICSPQAPAGRIVLDTGHPESPTLTIRVCFAIIP